MAVIDLVKYNNQQEVFAWKFPNSELSTWTQLIVNESQEAVLYKGGQALDLFGPGRHTLETANIPVLNEMVKIPFGGKSPFSAEVWFVNKATSLDIKWGTRTPIQIQDPKYNVFIPLRAYGQFGIRITDSKLFLKKFVGALPTFEAKDITNYLRGTYLAFVKDLISTYLVKNGVSILEINSHIIEISESLKSDVAPIFAEYGIELVNFYVNDISTPEDDVAVEKLKKALAKKAEMNIIGYSYNQERSFDTLEGAATNTGSDSSQMMGAGIGLGMGVGMGKQFGGAFDNMGSNINVNPTKKCPHCQGSIDLDDKFCPNCGQNVTMSENTMSCSNCGAKNNKNTKFCSECGIMLLKTCSTCQSVLEKDQKFCSNCGTSTIKKCANCGFELDNDTKFCPDCGQKVGGN